MGRPTTANLGATSPRLRAGWTGMLDGTSRSTIHEHELNDELHHDLHRNEDGEGQGGGSTAASSSRDEPDPVTSVVPRLAF